RLLLHLIVGEIAATLRRGRRGLRPDGGGQEKQGRAHHAGGRRKRNLREHAWRRSSVPRWDESSAGTRPGLRNGSRDPAWSGTGRQRSSPSAGRRGGRTVQDAEGRDPAQGLERVLS